MKGFVSAHLWKAKVHIAVVLSSGERPKFTLQCYVQGFRSLSKQMPVSGNIVPYETEEAEIRHALSRMWKYMFCFRQHCIQHRII